MWDALLDEFSAEEAIADTELGDPVHRQIWKDRWRLVNHENPLSWTSMQRVRFALSEHVGDWIQHDVRSQIWGKARKTLGIPKGDAIPEPILERMQPVVHDWPGWTDDEIRSVTAPTLLVIGDHDFVRLDHAAADSPLGSRLDR